MRGYFPKKARSLLERACRDGDGTTAGFARIVLARREGADEGSRYEGSRAGRLLREALQVLPTTSAYGLRLRGDVSLGLGYRAAEDGDLRAARARMEEALRLHERSGTRSRLLVSQFLLATTEVGLGEFATARTRFEQTARGIAPAHHAPLLRCADVGAAIAAALGGDQNEARAGLARTAAHRDDRVNAAGIVEAAAQLLPDIAAAWRAGRVGDAYADDPTSVQRRCADTLRCIIP